MSHNLEIKTVVVLLHTFSPDQPLNYQSVLSLVHYPTALDMSASRAVDLKETRVARFGQLAVCVGKPYYFLVCRTYGTALRLSRIPQHFSSSKNHNYERKYYIDLLDA
jgi:hypothetical protein